ncbi:MAG: acetyl-CoA carboxylase biotin carboxyl carrier protein subunit [Bdellovibrionales bacterium]|nr:acetyl-CoA carboxylase biotin carboxyl carrier protein subunit [Bdellovibrionales bacterium]
MKPIYMEVNGESKKVFAQKINGALWVHVDGKTLMRPLLTKKSRNHNKHVTANEPGVLTAPMPGKILEVKIKVGDDVCEGQILVVMEAMKMEYSLKSDIDGKIKSISVNVGDQVTLGRKLAEVSSNG